jgi:hypothetical protein
LRLACVPSYSLPGCQQQAVREVRASRELPTDATDATDTAGLRTTKLMVPVPRWQPVARQRLFGLLDEGTRGPLTLPAAPAGYGKILLMTSWTTGARPPGPVAWVRVGPGDHHPPQFWAHVLAALRGAEVVPPDGLLAGLSPQVEIGDGFLHAFLAGLFELRRPCGADPGRPARGDRPGRGRPAPVPAPARPLPAPPDRGHPLRPAAGPPPAAGGRATQRDPRGRPGRGHRRPRPGHPSGPGRRPSAAAGRGRPGSLGGGRDGPRGRRRRARDAPRPRATAACSWRAGPRCGCCWPTTCTGTTPTTCWSGPCWSGSGPRPGGPPRRPGGRPRRRRWWCR